MSNQGIGRAARRLRIGVLLAGGILGLLYLASRLQLGGDSVQIERGMAAASPLAPWAGDVLVLLLAAALLPLIRLLRVVEQGELFSAKVVGLFRSFAMWLLLLTTASLGAPLLLELVEGARDGQLALRLNLRDLLVLAITLLLFLIARLIERARLIEDEMRAIV